MIKDAEGLIRTVDEVNTTLVSAKRVEAVTEIGKLADQVKQELDRAAADTKLRSECLDPLDRLRTGVQSQESIAHIAQAQQRAEQCFETALTSMENAIADPPVKPGVVADPSPPPEKSAVKPHCTIQPAALMNKAFLETGDDVRVFVELLRKHLEEAVTAGKRVRIG